VLKLTDKELAMQAGELGEARRWSIDNQIKVGRMFDAEDLIPVSQAHMMVDPESVGEAGVSFLEKLADQGTFGTLPFTSSLPSSFSRRFFRDKIFCVTSDVC